MTNLKHSLTFASVVLALGALALALAPSSTASAGAVPLATPEQPRIVLWNEDHCQITDLIGEWRVRSAPRGSRMRPQHGECYIKLLSSVDGVEYQYRVGTAGEVYIAHGWIAVNQVHQETWSSGADQGSVTESSASDLDVSDCAISFNKEQVLKFELSGGSCWRSEVTPATGCDAIWHCLQGTGGCGVEIELVNQTVHHIEAECGSGGMIKQCTTAPGVTTVCYRD